MTGKITADEATKALRAEFRAQGIRIVKE